MKITICASIDFAPKILETRDKLESLGHKVWIPKSMIDYSIKTANSAHKLKSKRKKYLKDIKPYYTRVHFNLIKKSDAILVINIDKKGIKNYISGATFAEIMIALYLKKKIFFLNPIPKDKRLSFILDELEAVHPIVLNEKLEKIKK